MIRIGRNPKAVLLGGSALTLALFASSAAQAQCTGGAGLGPLLALFTPLASGGGATVSSLVSALTTTNTAFLNQTNAFIGAPANPQPNTMGGGVWARGIGGRVDVDATGINTFNVPTLGLTDTLTCNTTTRQEFFGYQAGADIARLNVGGWNMHWGVTVGYTESDAEDVTPGGTFSGTFQSPFAGVYGAATYGGFFVDGQVRWDFYQNTINDPANSLVNQKFDARGWAVSANIGYHHSFGNWFLEPSAGIVHSNVEVDRIDVAGTFAAGTGVSPPGSLLIDDIESTLLRASLRVGTTFASGNFILQPFATASVFHEFAGDVTANVTANFANIFGVDPFGFGDFNAAISTSRVGTYGQFALGIAGQLANTGWLGYARVDYRIGENVEGWIANGGIRYQFTPEQIAAVMGKGIVTKAPPLPIPQVINWTGFYVGGFAGTTWGQWDDHNIGGDPTQRVEPTLAGVMGGGQVGFNYQFANNFVVGAEFDAGWTNAEGSRSCPNLFFVNCVYFTDWIATATLRAGYAYERALFYVKGGGAWAEHEYPIFSNLTGLVIGTANDTRSGWTVGAGFEFALTQNWSAGAEYNFMDFGTEHIVLTSGDFSDISTEHHAVKVRVNYRLGSLLTGGR
jgi:opacity protein-like surface antigen